MRKLLITLAVAAAVAGAVMAPAGKTWTGTSASAPAGKTWTQTPRA